MSIEYRYILLIIIPVHHCYLMLAAFNIHLNSRNKKCVMIRAKCVKVRCFWNESLRTSFLIFQVINDGQSICFTAQIELEGWPLPQYCFGFKIFKVLNHRQKNKKSWQKVRNDSANCYIPVHCSLFS